MRAQDRGAKKGTRGAGDRAMGAGSQDQGAIHNAEDRKIVYTSRFVRVILALYDMAHSTSKLQHSESTLQHFL